jgi:TonB family protein
MKYIYLITICVCVLINGVFPQQSKPPGIELYKAGKYREAIVSLNGAVKDKQYEKNGEIWNLLGLTYLAVDDLKNARKSLEKAVKLDQANSIFHGNLAYVYLLQRNSKKARSEADKAIKIDPQNVPALIVRGTANYWDRKHDAAERDIDQAILLDDKSPQPYLVKSKILIDRMSQRLVQGSSMRKELALLRQATETLKTGLEKCVPTTKCKEITEDYETMSIFLDYFSKNKPDDIHPPTSVPPPPEPGTTPIKIISKPRPAYTDSARSAAVEGTVEIVAMFGANGKIEHVLFLSRLGSGLDEQVLRAARSIKFEPATKDGKPVSVVRRIEYSFDIY